ncbi:hypothetical protein BHE74_00013300 [Ensete ventricosum]|nr:hypothetical protein BHE74_00013300 [Ensete ventricosum]
MRLGTRLECVMSLAKVSGACWDGTREFVGRRPRLFGRLSRVVEKIVRSWEDVGLESSLGIGSGFGRCSGNSSRDRRKLTEGIEGLLGVYRKLAKGIEGSLGVRRELAEGIESSPGACRR